jgi:hypothetical protein
MKYFSRSEFNCKCGCGLGYDQYSKSTLSKLDNAREYAGVSFVLTSAARCLAHNEQEGGSSTSSHLASLATNEITAVDIEAQNSAKRFRIIEGLIKAGFKRIGIAKTFIHADDDPDKPAMVAWLY